MIQLMQTETTYNVNYVGNEYTITRMEDINSGYISYEIFYDDGELVEDENMESEIITYLEENV